jgi:hypothetical protein
MNEQARVLPWARLAALKAEVENARLKTAKGGSMKDSVIALVEKLLWLQLGPVLS